MPSFTRFKWQPTHPVAIGEFERVIADIESAQNPVDNKMRRQILKKYVKELVVDQERQRIEGILLGPLAIGAYKLVAPGGVEPFRPETVPFCLQFVRGKGLVWKGG